MNRRTLALTLALASLVPASLGAQQGSQLTADPDLPTTRTGTRGAAFLALGVGARAQALAGAYTALAGDISALYWNTAGIGRLEGFSAGISRASLYGDLGIDHTFVGVVLPLGLSRLGVSVNTLSSGTMQWADEGYPNTPIGGEVNPIRTDFEWTATAVAAHLARPITDRLLVGGAVKYISEGISNATASFVGVDIGTIFDTGIYGITLGAALQNVGTSGRMGGLELEQEIDTGNSENQVQPFDRVIGLRADTKEVELPTMFRFSLAADLIGGASSMIAPNPDNSLRVVWDVNDAINTGMQTAVGIEYGFRDFAFLRAGKRWNNEAQIEHEFARNASFGAGVRIPMGDLGRLVLDYAYTNMVDLDNIQMLTVELHF